MAIPLCPYFTQRGGCTAQHIDYDLQVENKKKYLQQITKKEDIQVFSDKKYNYRNRMDLIFHKNGLGLRKKGHWDKIIPIEQCVIAEEKINILMREIQQTFTNCDAFDLRKHSGTFRYAVIRSTPEDSSISFVLSKNSTRIAEAIEQIKHFAQKSTAKKISEENKCSNVSAMLLDAKQISRLQLKKPLFVITDPPRTGMDQKTIAVLNQEQPECIIYISCNPQQLAKDLPKFKDYEIQSVALFDLFPQTPHSEAIIGLTKKKP